jgi:uncharacterized protein YgbK (DUF1537 family)
VPLYKKMDSTLRGAAAAELAGLLEATGHSQVLLAPALPEQRRTVRDGVLHVGGRPAGEGPLAQDPAFPPTGSSVLALAGAGGLHPVASIPLATVRRGPDAVRGRRLATIRTLVADAETDADLAAVASAVVDGSCLLAGSAGLAAALAARLGPGGRPEPGGPAAVLQRPLLVVAGSLHPATRLQLEGLVARGVGGVWLREGDAGDPPGPRAPDGDWFVASHPPEPGPAIGAREAMAARLAAVARGALSVRPDRFRTLLLTGGETAVAVCRALEAPGIRLVGELERGLAVGRLARGPWQGLPVVTKAGGFGSADTLVRIWEACG